MFGERAVDINFQNIELYLERIDLPLYDFIILLPSGGVQ